MAWPTTVRLPVSGANGMIRALKADVFGVDATSSYSDAYNQYPIDHPPKRWVKVGGVLIPIG